MNNDIDDLIKYAMGDPSVCGRVVTYTTRKPWGVGEPVVVLRKKAITFIIGMAIHLYVDFVRWLP